VTSSWFFLSTLNYDARSTTHQISQSIVVSSALWSPVMINKSEWIITHYSEGDCRPIQLLLTLNSRFEPSYFFYFQHYNSLSVLACSIISFHFFLSCVLLLPIGHPHLPQIIPHIVFPSYSWPSLRSCCLRFPFVYGLGHSFITNQATGVAISMILP